jgi:hypothetical protein
MKKEYFNYLRGGAWLLFALLVGLPNMMAAAGQTDELVITKDVRYEDEVNVKKLIIRDNSEEPTDRIDIYLENNSTVETITVESGNAEIFFSGAEGVEYNLGSITVAQGAELTLSLGFPRQMNIGSVTNNGRFIDLTGSVQKVGGTHSFEIQQAEGYSKMGTLGIHSEIKKETLDPEMEVSLQKKEGENWKDDEAIKDALAEHIAFSVSESGTYRLKWVYKDDKNNGYAELYSKEINLLQITGNETLKDVHYNAIALNNGNITEATKVSMDNVHADPCTIEENAAGFSVGLYSNLELTLTGTNSELGILRNHGTMVLKQEGDAQLENTTIYNEGTFTDETGNKGMILGPAGLWIQEIKPNADITAPDGTQLKSISFQYAIKSFYKKIIVETYRNGQWMNYDEIKGGESENENPELRSTQGDETEKWTLRASYVFTTAIKGTYRFKIETTNDKNTPTCKTIWYSQPYELIASEFEINNDQLALGEANNTTVIPSLLITAGKDGSEKDATLENIEISEHAVETPSVNVEEGAKVNLTLKGTNDLGSIQLAKGSTMTLKPETTGDENMSDKLFISSVRNGGSFTDETATVSSVKDLENHTMIEFTDTIIYQVGDAISVTLRAVGNSSTGGYLLLGDHTIEKFGGSGWEDAQSKPQLRAGETAENPNQSAESVLNLTTTEIGIYRMKVTSTDIEDKAHNATLYFMFEIADLEDELTIKTIDGTTTSIDGTSEEYKNANMLIFGKDEGTASPVEVTLNNVQLKEAGGYEEYTSSVVAKKQNYELTLNGTNDLATFFVEEGATATLKRGDSFESLNATVYNAGKFTDETGTIQKVVDSKGLTMVDITGYELPAWNGYILKVNFDFFFGNYEVISVDKALEHLVDGEWVAYHNSVMRSAEGTSEWSDPQSGEIAYTYTGLEEGKYRVKVYAEEWITGIEGGSKENPHAVTLYHYFTISEPAPEPTYYGITLPSVEGATTSPAAGTYWEYEGSSFSFSLTLDPAYDQSKPEVKANGQVVTPSENGTYTIANISEDVTITIEGIAENTPTGNAEVDDDSVKVWGADGILHLYTPVKAKVWVYTLNGVLVRAVDEVIGNQTISLAGGSYIIVIDDQKYKLRF